MATERFREEQRYRQVWLWVLLLGVNAYVIGLFGYGLVQQVVQGERWGNRPMSDTGLVISFIVAVLFCGGLLLLFWFMTLVVEVRPEGIFIHYKFLKRRTIGYDEIARVEPCRYRPIMEYGGWGIRRGRKGWAYNVSGNEGVRLWFHDGKSLLIGSQRPQHLAAAIEAERKR